VNHSLHNRAYALKEAFLALLLVSAFSLSLASHGLDYSFRWILLALSLLISIITLQLVIQCKDRFYLPRSLPAISYFALLVLSALSLLWSAVPGSSFLSLLKLSTCLLAITISANLTQTQWQYSRYLLLPVTLSIVFYSAYQAFMLHIPKASGFLLNYNTNAAIMVMLFIPFCADFLQTRRLKNSLCWGIFFMTVTFAMSLTQSRGALVTLFISLIPIIFVAHKLSIKRSQTGYLLVYLAGGYILGDIAHGGLLFDRLTQQIQQVSSQPTAAGLQSLGSGRDALWRAGWQMYLDKPGLGWGLDLFHWLYPQYRQPLNAEAGQYVHNDYLDFLIGLGPIGLILSLTFYITTCLQLPKLLKSPLTDNDKLSHITLLSPCIAILTHSLVTFNLYQTPVLILLGIYIGRVDRITHIQPITATAKKFSYPAITLLIFVSLQMALFSLFWGFKHVYTITTLKLPQQQLRYLHIAERHVPFMEKSYILEAIVIIDLMEHPAPDITRQELQSLADYALKKLNQSIEKNPLRAQSYSLKGEIQIATAKTPADIQQGIKSFYQALRLNPYAIKTRLQTFYLLQKDQQQQTARQVLLQGLGKHYFARYDDGLTLLYTIKQMLENQDSDPRQIRSIAQQIVRLSRQKQQAGSQILKDNFVINRLSDS